MWSEGKRRRQLQKEICVRTSFHLCLFFCLFCFILKGFVCQAASGDVSVCVVGVSTSGSLIFFFFFFFNMGEDHSLPFVSKQMFYHAFYSSRWSIFFVRLFFFAVQRVELGDASCQVP